MFCSHVYILNVQYFPFAFRIPIWIPHAKRKCEISIIFTKNFSHEQIAHIAHSLIDTRGNFRTRNNVAYQLNMIR